MNSRWTHTIGSIAVVVLAARTSHAQAGADIAARRDLVSQAEAARTANDHARALDLATRAGQIQMTASLRMMIAQEQMSLNRFADALGTAQQCVRESDDPTVRNRAAIRHTCDEIVASAETRVGRVVVSVPTPAPDGLVVTVNGNPLNPAFFGVPYVVTAGAVSIAASATNRHEVRRDLTVNPGGNTPVAIAFEATAVATNPPPHEPEPASPTPTPVIATPLVVASAAPVEPPHTESHSASIAGPAVVMGLGGVGVVLGVVFFALRSGATSTLDAMCTADMGTGCPASLANVIEDAHRDTLGMGLSLGLGGAALAGGLIWLLTQRSGGNTERHAGMIFAPSFAQGAAMLTVGGAL